MLFKVDLESGGVIVVSKFRLNRKDIEDSYPTDLSSLKCLSRVYVIEAVYGI